VAPVWVQCSQGASGRVGYLGMVLLGEKKHHACLSEEDLPWRMAGFVVCRSS